MNSTIHTSDNLFCLNSSSILELSVKFASQICHENTNIPLDGTYLVDFGIDIRYSQKKKYPPDRNFLMQNSTDFGHFLKKYSKLRNFIYLIWKP